MTGHKFTLLQAFPWLNEILLKAAGAGELRNHQALQPYGTSITAIINKLDRFETDDEMQKSFKSILFAQPAHLIESRLTNLSAVKADKLSNLAATLLDYRLLDVAISLQIGASPAGQGLRLPIPLPPKMYFKQTSDWPSLISRGLQLLRECEDDLSRSDTLPLNPTLSIFSHLLHRKESVDGHKIMSNFECTAAHLNLILRGIVDLPNTLEEFKSLVLDLCLEHTEPVDRWERFFDSIKSPHSFKLPLHIALSCSPICLFLPSCIMTKDLNRLVVLQIWQGLGGPRPEQFQVIEHTLWRALFEAASGISPLHTRLKAAFQTIGFMDLSRTGYPSSEWLSGDAHFTGMQPKLLVPKKSQSTARSNLPALQNAHRSQRDGAVDTTEAKADVSPPPGRTTRSQIAKLDPQPTSRLSAQPHSITPKGKTPARKALNQGVKGKGRALSESSSSEGEEESEDDEDDEDYARNVAPARKRTRSTLSTKDTSGPEHGVKALKLEDGTRAVRVYEAIDLTSEAVGPPLIDLTLDDTTQEDMFRTPVCILWDCRSSMIEFMAKFHFRQEAEWFTTLFRITKGCQPGDRPQFLGDRNSSFFTVLRDVIAGDVPAGDMQELFRKRAIIAAQTVVADCLFDSRSTRRFCMLDKVISIRDFSIPLEQDRMTTGTVGQVLRSADSNGKSLAALDVPIPGGAAPLPSLASDVHAWDMTIDQAWCSRRWELPRSAVRWAEISTVNAYRPLSLSPNGFATQIEVVAGSQLLVLCQPSAFNPHPMSSVAMLERFRNPYIADTKTFDYQAIHLLAGDTAIIKPLTPFLLMSTKNSIVQMSHFYAMSTIQSTCIGFMHSALTMNADMNPAQKAAQSLLRRLVHYLHLVYMNEDFIICPQNYPHVPDILTTPGVIDVLSLCNVFEIMNMLAYTLSDLDRHLFIEARRLCRRIVAWMQARFTFTDQEARRLDISKDLWMPYLAQQLKTLRDFQTLLYQRGMNIVDKSTFCDRLDAFERNHQTLRSGLQNRRHWTSDDFQWPTHLVFSVSLRLSPDSIPEEIRGETHDDLVHLGN